MIFNKAMLYLEVRKGNIKATELTSNKTVIRGSDALAHPRSLMGDFLGVASCFKNIVNELCPKTFLSGPTTIFVHLLENSEGGFTNVEIRAFKEAALGAGGQVIKFPNSLTLLSKEELLNGEFTELNGI